MSATLVRQNTVDIIMSPGQTNWPFVINVSNSIIGVTVLAMPFCFKTCGILLGIVMLFFSTWLTVRSCQLLMKAGVTSRRRSYSLLAYYTHGATGKLIVELGMIGLQLGTLVAQVVIIGDLGPAIVSKFTGLPNTDRLRTGLIVFLCLFVGLPLGLLKDVRMLSKTSAMCILFYGFFTVYVVLLSGPRLITGAWWSKVRLWRMEGFFQCLPIFSFAFGCQTQLFIVYEALSEPSLKRINSIVSSAVHMCTAAYLLVGFFGYIAFCEVSDLSGDIINHFAENKMSDAIKMCFVCSIAVSIPLIVFPCRASLYTLLFPQKPKEDVPGAYKIPEVHFKVITTFIVVGSMIIGILVPNVEFVLGLNGATMGTLICYIFPALFFLAVMSDTSEGKLSGRLVLAFGLTILIVSTYTTLNTPSPADTAVQPPTGLERELDKLPTIDDPKLDGVDKDVPVDDTKKDDVKEPPDKDAVKDDERQEPPIPLPPDDKDGEHPASDKDKKVAKVDTPVVDKEETNKEVDAAKQVDDYQKKETKYYKKKRKYSDNKDTNYEKKEEGYVEKKEEEVVKKETEEEKKDDYDQEKRLKEVEDKEKALEEAEEKRKEADKKLEEILEKEEQQKILEEKALEEAEEKRKEADKKQEEILEKLEQQKEEQQKILEEQKHILEELKQHQDTHKDEEAVKSQEDPAVAKVQSQQVVAKQLMVDGQAGQQLVNNQLPAGNQLPVQQQPQQFANNNLVGNVPGQLLNQVPLQGQQQVVQQVVQQQQQQGGIIPAVNQQGGGLVQNQGLVQQQAGIQLMNQQPVDQNQPFAGQAQAGQQPLAVNQAVAGEQLGMNQQLGGQLGGQQVAQGYQGGAANFQQPVLDQGNPGGAANVQQAGLQQQQQAAAAGNQQVYAGQAANLAQPQQDLKPVGNMPLVDSAGNNMKPIVSNDQPDIKQVADNARVKRDASETVDMGQADADGKGRDLKQLDRQHEFVNEFLELNLDVNGKDGVDQTGQVVDKDINELNNKINKELDFRHDALQMSDDPEKKR